MAPGPVAQDLGIYRGDTFEYGFYLSTKVYNAATGVYDRVRMNLSGYTPKAQIRNTVDAANLVVELTCTIPDQSVAANVGYVLLSLTATQTSALNPKTGSSDVWDFQLTSASGRVKTYLKGSVTYDADVTR